MNGHEFDLTVSDVVHGDSFGAEEGQDIQNVAINSKILQFYSLFNL